MVVIPEKMSKVEFEEINRRLNSRGLGPFLEILMEKDSEAYTKSGRLNKSAICRKLGFTNKELENALGEVRREFVE